MIAMDQYINNVYSILYAAITTWDISPIYITEWEIEAKQAKLIKLELSKIIPNGTISADISKNMIKNFIHKLAEICFDTYYLGERNRTDIIKHISKGLCQQFKNNIAFFKCAVFHILEHYDNYSNPPPSDVSL